MALRLLILVCLSLSSVRCYGIQSSTQKITILSEMQSDIMLSKCRRTGMGTLLDENIVDFLKKCDLPRPESDTVKTAVDAEAFLCLGYYDVSLNLCKYFSGDENPQIDLPMNAEKVQNVSKLLDNLTDFCASGHLAVGPSDFEQTKPAIKPLLALLSDHNKCRKVCYDLDDALKPICKFLLWTNRKLSAYLEIQKGHEKITALKKTLTPLLPPKDDSDTRVESKLLPPMTSSEIVNKNSTVTPLSDYKPNVPANAVDSIAPSSPKKIATVPKPNVYKQASTNNVSEPHTASPVETTKMANVESPVTVTKKPIDVKPPPLSLNPAEKSTPVQQQPKVPIDPDRIMPQQQQVSEEHMTGSVFERISNNFPDANSNPDPNIIVDEFSHNDMQSSNSRDPDVNYEGGEDPDQIADSPPEMPSSSAAAKGRPNSATSVDHSGYTVTGHSVEAEDSRFFPIFFLCLGVVIVVYVLFHNKHKVLGLLVEGRRGEGRRRGVGGPAYRKLDCTLEEAVNSAPPSHGPHIVY